uniref:Uncharacterized protein n=1 Tax=Rhizophora mucronata TaxID=61149 RepID=A0A2P2Q8E2_RHIMU
MEGEKKKEKNGFSVVFSPLALLLTSSSVKPQRFPTFCFCF